MKQFLSGSLLLFMLSCTSPDIAIVSPLSIDSVLQSYALQPTLLRNQQEIDFWQNRIVSGSSGITNESRLAGEWVNRFQLTGNISFLLKADSIAWKITERYNNKETSPFILLTYNAIRQHRFSQADSLLTIAREIGLKPYEQQVAGFDVSYELGRYEFAEEQLKRVYSSKDYNVLFRLAKLAHYKGELDSAIHYMATAARLAEGNIQLKQAALANAGDLCMHAGKPSEAYQYYLQSLRLSYPDLHSLLGLGMIALIHDRNDNLAEKIFRFASNHSDLPDVTWKLMLLAETRGDSMAMVSHARRFEQEASALAFGNMYNKYLLQLYTGVLPDPVGALQIAERELKNRNNPQTNAWYAWALMNNGHAAKALAVYKEKVSGKPLEGLELYYMGRLMDSLDRYYNASQFYKLAKKNEFDLTPYQLRDLDQRLE